MRPSEYVKSLGFLKLKHAADYAAISPQYLSRLLSSGDQPKIDTLTYGSLVRIGDNDAVRHYEKGRLHALYRNADKYFKLEKYKYINGFIFAEKCEVDTRAETMYKVLPCTGIDTIDEAVELSGIPKSTLNGWWSKYPKRVETVVRGMLVKRGKTISDKQEAILQVMYNTARRAISTRSDGERQVHVNQFYELERLL